MFMSFNSKTRGATSGAGTTYPYGAREFTSVFVEFVLLDLSVLYFVDYR